jgi:hypothetical protein
MDIIDFILHILDFMLESIPAVAGRSYIQPSQTLRMYVFYIFPKRLLVDPTTTAGASLGDTNLPALI